MKASTTVPEMGTPEFREFVQTPEWMEMRHEAALEDNKLWEIDPRLVIRSKRFENDAVRSPYFMPRQLGATALCDPRLFSRDFRERLPIDEPLRMDYEESIHGKTEAELRAEDIEGLGQLHRAALLTTSIDR